MFFCDLLKQRTHAPIPCCYVFLRGRISTGVGISDRKIFCELGIRTEMPGVGRVSVVFFGPCAIGVAAVATNTTDDEQKR